MLLNNYNDFILESKIDSLVNEGLLAYSKDFINTLNYISKNKIAEKLIKLSAKTCDVNANYITVGDTPGTAKFIQDNRIDTRDLVFKLTNAHRFMAPGFALVGKSGFSKEGLLNGFNKMNNRFRLLDSKIFPNGDNGETVTVYHLQFLDNESKYAIVYDFSEDPDPLLEVIEDVDVSKASDIKIGRLATKILSSLGIEYAEKDIEEFVNMYTSASNIGKNIFNSFKVVKGEDLRACYLVNNYYDSEKAKYSQLWKSCMSYDYCQSYLDIYVENPDKISLLVFMNEDSKVMGRALLWNLDQHGLFMDRVYAVSDTYIHTFEKWGVENGYDLYRTCKDELIVTLKSKHYDEYPYMDTFKYYDVDNGVLSNDGDNLKTSDYICLAETDGSYT